MDAHITTVFTTVFRKVLLYMCPDTTISESSVTRRYVQTRNVGETRALYYYRCCYIWCLLLYAPTCTYIFVFILLDRCPQEQKCGWISKERDVRKREMRATDDHPHIHPDLSGGYGPLLLASLSFVVLKFIFFNSTKVQILAPEELSAQRSCGQVLLAIAALKPHRLEA